MTRQEFIRKLQEALNGKLDATEIQDHLKFYDDYIIEEMRKGKSEQEVLELLGDPWAIAKTIVDASDGTDEEVVYENRSPFNNSYNQTTQAQNSYTGYGQKNEYGTEHSYGSYHEFRLDTWWKKALLILAVVFVVVVVVSVITGIISFLAPVLVPLLIIMIVIRLIGGNRRY